MPTKYKSVTVPFENNLGKFLTKQSEEGWEPVYIQLISLKYNLSWTVVLRKRKIGEK